MRRQLTSLALMACGVLALIFGMTIGPTPSPAAAMPALQPSPRPTLQPTPDFATATPTSEVPTTVPPPVDEPAGKDSVPTPQPLGRVTGTVIDLRTNAPAPNKLVAIGDMMVLSDSNGNYDRWVESGYYRLALELRSDEGTPTQGSQEIAVGPGDTVVVHLFFTSPAPTPEPMAPSAEPVMVSPVAIEQPAPVLPTLPDTSVERAPAAQLSAPPSGLPTTAAPTMLLTPGMWFLGGALFLAFGLIVQFIPRRRRAAQRALLGQLLNEEPSPTRRGPAELLRDLLDRDV